MRQKTESLPVELEVWERVRSPELRDADFNTLCELVRDHCGISLHAGKENLVKARLGKRLRLLGMRSFHQYLDYLRAGNGEEFTLMLDALATNVTHFFRESNHFDFLVKKFLPPLTAPRPGKERRLRFWSAGCSSGEEPYTLAIVLHEQLPNIRAWDVRILATDLSTQALAKARRGIYAAEKLQELPPRRVSSYFNATAEGYQARPELRRLVHFARLNLIGDWPMRGPFDVIFCRNVMIYFDRDLRQRLIRRFWELLRFGGVFFIGHSESLSGMAHNFTYVAPTIFQKL